MSWNPTQYLKYSGVRLRPALDLLARIPLATPESIVDLGCGAGNVTALIAERWPRARIIGVDNSKEMLAVAGAHEDMEDAFLARERHLDALRDTGSYLASAMRHFAVPKPPLELVAEDLRSAHTALAAITGEYTSDDLLGAIFSRFCIGK